MNEQRVIATYERVSSDDQRERETIKTQTEVIDRHIALNPDAHVYQRYRDDGVSGTIEGIRLLIGGGGLNFNIAADPRSTLFIDMN